MRTRLNAHLVPKVVRRLLAEGHRAGIIANPVNVEFVE
jgi:hypothetical protein